MILSASKVIPEKPLIVANSLSTVIAHRQEILVAKRLLFRNLCSFTELGVISSGLVITV